MPDVLSPTSSSSSESFVTLVTVPVKTAPSLAIILHNSVSNVGAAVVFELDELEELVVVVVVVVVVGAVLDEELLELEELELDVVVVVVVVVVVAAAAACTAPMSVAPSLCTAPISQVAIMLFRGLTHYLLNHCLPLA